MRRPPPLTIQLETGSNGSSSGSSVGGGDQRLGSSIGRTPGNQSLQRSLSESFSHLRPPSDQSLQRTVTAGIGKPRRAGEAEGSSPRPGSNPTSPVSPTRSPLSRTVSRNLMKGTDNRMRRKPPTGFFGNAENAQPDLEHRLSGALSCTGLLSTPSGRTPSAHGRRRNSGDMTAQAAAFQGAMTQAMRRRVCFCPTPKNTQHVVTPYGQIYGQHPKFFDFDRKGQMQLNDAGIAEELRRQEQPSPKDNWPLLLPSS
mmetsp:Transcript_62001/g.199914  ORF Transcript_62001/g.199914 Transcript_62001/m.199914 type:complete len:256 (+) Transcript_62001:87-854(+)